jgi:hypothetical protein
VTKIDQLVEILERSRNSFFHFTDTRNLPLIREHGLLSMRTQRDRQRVAIAPGGNDWSLDADRRSGMDRYVHLCFFDEHPMEWLARQQGRIENSTFLRVEPKVLMVPGVMMTDIVANRRDAVPETAERMVGQHDLKVIYTRTDWKDSAVQERLKSARKYEILVPDHVPLELIKGL